MADPLSSFTRGVAVSLASCPGRAAAPYTGGIHSDEVWRYPVDPRLEPGIDERRALGLGVQMMRRAPYQHEPSLTRVHIDLVHLHRDQVLGVLDTSTQVLVKEDGVPRAQDKRPCIDLVHDRQRRGSSWAVVDQTREPPTGEQVHGLGLAHALRCGPGIRSRAGRGRTAWRV